MEWVRQALLPERSVVFVDVQDTGESRSEDQRRKVAQLMGKSLQQGETSMKGGGKSIQRGEMSIQRGERSLQQGKTSKQQHKVDKQDEPCDPQKQEDLKGGGGIINTSEAKVVDTLVSGLLQCDMKPTDIGVCSVYRSQVYNIRQWISSSLVEVDTVDRFQGRDKSVIVVSMVRNNLQGQVGQLLKGFRRLNVAFTRAKAKLIIVGASATLRHGEHTNKMLQILESRDWIIKVPAEEL